MKNRYFLQIAFLFAVISFSSLAGFSQNKEKMILGKWIVTDFKHYDENKELDQEATNHYGRMIKNRRTHTYHANGVVDIPGYDNCAWKLEGDMIMIRYSENGAWEDELIQKLEDDIMITKDEVDFPSPGQTHVTTYEWVE